MTTSRRPTLSTARAAWHVRELSLGRTPGIHVVTNSASEGDERASVRFDGSATRHADRFTRAVDLDPGLVVCGVVSRPPSYVQVYVHAPDADCTSCDGSLERALTTVAAVSGVTVAVREHPSGDSADVHSPATRLRRPR